MSIFVDCPDECPPLCNDTNSDRMLKSLVETSRVESKLQSPIKNRCQVHFFFTPGDRCLTPIFSPIFWSTKVKDCALWYMIRDKWTRQL